MYKSVAKKLRIRNDKEYVHVAEQAETYAAEETTFGPSVNILSNV